VTFCIGIKVSDGIVALADSRIVVGTSQSTKRKLATIDHPTGTLFTMTSGLRSIRDKTLTYLAETVRDPSDTAANASGTGPENKPGDDQRSFQTRVYQVANEFGNQLRRVRAEDEASLVASGLSFNSHAIIGGRLVDDTEPQLYYVYPEGNWIESSVDVPYFMIGRTHYGKPILDRLLRYDTPLQQALLLALLAFDATRTSVTDVDGPIDVAVLPADNNKFTFRRLADADFAESTDWWSKTLRDALAAMPHRWTEGLF
jgi:putative proteasome-type protease